MRDRITPIVLAFLLAPALVSGVAMPAAAANKEHQQLMADIRMLQEQAQILQNMLGSLNEALKAVNTRIDDQTNTLRKTFADQKLLIDNLSSDLRVVREKVDDNNVRIASLTQELDALRRAVQQSSLPRPSSTDPGGATPPGTVPTTNDASSMTTGVSPMQVFQQAFSDYTASQWDLAIQGFEGYIRTFPKSEQASEAQVRIGMAYDYSGNKTKAIEAFDRAIKDYPNGKWLPDAYYHKGLVLKDLKQTDKAREAFDHAAKTFPDTDAGRMSRQALMELSKRPD